MFKIVEKLAEFWKKHGATFIPTYDHTMGAATYHRFFFLQSLGKEDFKYYYLQPSTRIADCRYGESKTRFLKHHQFQVVFRPIPHNIQELYIKSLEYLGLSGDIKFVVNDWKSEALGAKGVGYEIWHNHLEICQYTYFTHMANQEVLPLVELAYGVERLAFALNADLPDFILQQDYFLSKFYQQQNSKELKDFHVLYTKTKKLIHDNYYAAYDKYLELNNIFNQLDLQKKINNTNRIEMIKKLQSIVVDIAKEAKTRIC